jgi:hypothetical protein
LVLYVIGAFAIPSSRKWALLISIDDYGDC